MTTLWAWLAVTLAVAFLVVVALAVEEAWKQR